MKKYLALVLLSGCGFASSNTKMIGQVKKVINNTPLICPDYQELELSLGVMRNGVGSMSHEDAEALITTPEQAKTLEDALISGRIVEVTYDKKRVTFCVPSKQITKVEILK